MVTLRVYGSLIAFFGFKLVGMNVNERERRAKNSSFGQIMVWENSQKIESWQFYHGKNF